MGSLLKVFRANKVEVNRWNIPEWLEREVIERDQKCVYCGIEFGEINESRKSMPTWEHIVNDARIITRENIVRYCFSCNASKGAKELSVWLKSEYCVKRGISNNTVAEVVKSGIIKPPQLSNSRA